MREETILSPSQVSGYIKSWMDRDRLLSGLLVRGELSNYKMYPSGHHYFTLKDSQGALRCVMFRGDAASLRFRPENGMQVIAAGRITVFPRDGQYQLYCVRLTPEGAGDLHVAFEQLKEKLLREGLFDQAHKRPLPAYPRRIALITSPAGAAVRDMLRILGARYPLAQVRVLPVRVQGEGAAGQICRALDEINRQAWAQVVVIIRGGGSLEDLWCFNEEDVATAIFSSKIPVLAGIGHEVDVTLADMTADVRAATPSHAAQLLWPLRREYWQRLDELSLALERARQGWLQRQEDRLQRCERALRLCSPARRLEGAALQWQQWQQRLLQAGERLLRDRELRLQHHQERLRALTGPGRLAHLQQRLALLEQKFGNAAHLMVRGREQVVRDCTRDLARLGQEAVSRRGHELECLELRLAACNPLAPLGRGYAVVRTAEGRVLSSTGQGSAGQDVRILLRDGELEARVTAVHPYDGQGGEHV